MQNLARCGCTRPQDVVANLRMFLLSLVAGLALRALQQMHLPAERNGWDDKEEYEESHSGFLNELRQSPAGPAAHHFRCEFGPPEKNFRSDD